MRCMPRDVNRLAHRIGRIATGQEPEPPPTDAITLKTTAGQAITALCPHYCRTRRHPNRIKEYTPDGNAVLL